MISEEGIIDEGTIIKFYLPTYKNTVDLSQDPFEATIYGITVYAGSEDTICDENILYSREY